MKNSTPAADEDGLDASADAADAQPASAETWLERAARVGATAFDGARGRELLVGLWGEDRHFDALAPADRLRLADYFDYAKVRAQAEVIGQNEAGNYLLVVLEGRLAVERVPVRGARVRLAEAHAGEMLGEMSLLDAGARFSTCTTLTPALLAVLDSTRLNEMGHRDPTLAVALLASLSRRLSLRLRQVSTRLSALLMRD